MAKAERIHNLMKQQDELFSRFLRTTDNTEANALYAVSYTHLTLPTMAVV